MLAAAVGIAFVATAHIASTAPSEWQMIDDQTTAQALVNNCRSGKGPCRGEWNKIQIIMTGEKTTFIVPERQTKRYTSDWPDWELSCFEDKITDKRLCSLYSPGIKIMFSGGRVFVMPPGRRRYPGTSITFRIDKNVPIIAPESQGFSSTGASHNWTNEERKYASDPPR